MPFSPIRYCDDTSNVHLEAMSEHLNPLFLSRLFRREELVLFRKYYNMVAGKGPTHHRLFEMVAGR